MSVSKATGLNDLYHFFEVELHEFCHDAFVNVIKQELGNILEQDKPSDYQQWMDGHEGAMIESVDKLAYFEFKYLRDVVAYAMECLLRISPVGKRPKKDSRKYIDNHLVFADGEYIGKVQDGETILNAIGGAKSVLFVNAVESAFGPGTYARKIEGYHGVKSISSQVGAEGVYGLSSTMVSAKFSAVVKVSFLWVGLDTVGTSILGGTAGNQSDVRFPALLIGEWDGKSKTPTVKSSTGKAMVAEARGRIRGK